MCVDFVGNMEGKIGEKLLSIVNVYVSLDSPAVFIENAPLFTVAEPDEALILPV